MLLTQRDTVEHAEPKVFGISNWTNVVNLERPSTAAVRPLALLTIPLQNSFTKGLVVRAVHGLIDFVSLFGLKEFAFWHVHLNSPAECRAYGPIQRYRS